MKTTTPTPNRKRTRKPKQQEQKFQDGYILASGMLKLIQQQVAAIAGACKEVAEKSTSSEEQKQHCQSYFNGALKLAEMLSTTIINSPRTETRPTEEEVH